VIFQAGRFHLGFTWNFTPENRGDPGFALGFFWAGENHQISPGFQGDLKNRGDPGCAGSLFSSVSQTAPPD